MYIKWNWLFISFLFIVLFTGSISAQQYNCHCRRWCHGWEEKSGSCYGYARRKCCPKETCTCRRQCEYGETQRGECYGWLRRKCCK
ncbi:hypothetical protein ACF0H5_019272 [Mactra antiquata]